MKSITQNGLKRLLALSIVPVFAVIVASRTLWQQADGTIATSLKTGWGDMLVHIRAATFFAQQGGIPHESFLLAGKPVGYAYAADYISSILLSWNIPLVASFMLPTVVLAVSIVLGIQWLTFRITKSLGSAILAAVLFMGFSGLQGFYIVPELLSSSGSFMESLQALPHDVTVWWDANMVIADLFIMMLHQRAYLLGFPVFLLVLVISHSILRKKESDTNALILLAVLGIALAFFHPHTWASTLLILPGWAAMLWLLRVRTFSKKDISTLLITYTCIVLGGFIMVKILQPKAGTAFLRWAPGWFEPTLAWPLFWIRNIGLHALLVPLSFIYFRKRNKALAALVGASIIPFIAGNLFNFAPWEWDNTKMFTPVWLILCVANASLLWNFAKKNTYTAALATLIIISLTLSGGLEIARVFTYIENPWGIASPANQAVGEAIRGNTSSEDLLLLAPQPDNPAFLFSGRPSLVAYEGWLWSNGWGGQYEQRITDMKKIYAGSKDAYTIIEQYGIDGIVVGPPEKSLNPNSTWLENTFRSVPVGSDTTLYLTY